MYTIEFVGGSQHGKIESREDLPNQIPIGDEVYETAGTSHGLGSGGPDDAMNVALKHSYFLKE